MPTMAGSVAGRQRTAPWRSRRGRLSPRACRVRITAIAVRTSRKVANTRAMRAWISRSGSLLTTPEASRTRPIGSCSASSPRAALARSPAVSRPRSVCSSSSEIVPLRPSRRRPFAEPASYTPSRSAIRHWRWPHPSRSGYQSEQFRASRVTSVERINPTSPRVTRATSSLKPPAVRGGAAAQAEVGVDDVDVRLTPAELAGALPQRVLQAQALLVAQHLVRGGLADVDHHMLAEVVRLDELRTHGSAPGEACQG